MSLSRRAASGNYNKVFGYGDRSDFPDPFLDQATKYMPDNFNDLLYFCEDIWERFGTWRAAMERVISYHVTAVDIKGDISAEEKTKYETFLEQTLAIIPKMQEMFRNRMAYGNAFATVYKPFKRFLRSPGGDLYAFSEVHRNPEFRFEFKNYEFVATCPKTKKRGAWKVEDKEADNQQSLRIKIWSPHEIKTIHDCYSGELVYFWKIPEEYKRDVTSGVPHVLEHCPKEVLKAVKENSSYRFKTGMLFHMKEPTLAGINNRGWGIPRILTNFRQIWYVQVLRRYNEAIALDYVIPFRLITPGNRNTNGSAGGLTVGDPFISNKADDLQRGFNAMMQRRRRDPTSWNFLPFPVQYQSLGGDANQLAPRDLLDQGVESLLNDTGTPMELYKGTLQLNTGGPALRLYESIWSHLIHDGNELLRWLIKQIVQIMSWETVEVKLRKVTVADDVQRSMAMLQLMTGQQVSGTTGLRSLDLDWLTEQKRIAEEAKLVQEMQARQQEEMAQAGFAQEIASGQPTQGGQPAQGGGQGQTPQAQNGQDAAAMGNLPVSQYLASTGPGDSLTPEDMMAVASSLADALLGLPETIKDSELRKLKQQKATLHSVVRAKLDEKRRDMKNQGGAMLQQQMYGTGAPAA